MQILLQVNVYQLNINLILWIIIYKKYHVVLFGHFLRKDKRVKLENFICNLQLKETFFQFRIIIWITYGVMHHQRQQSSAVEKSGDKSCSKTLYHIQHTWLRIINVFVYLVLLYRSLVLINRHLKCGPVENRLDCGISSKIPWGQCGRTKQPQGDTVHVITASKVVNCSIY